MSITKIIKDICCDKKIILYGYCAIGGKVHFILNNLGIDIYMIVDTNPRTQGVVSSNKLLLEDKTKVMVFVSSEGGRDEVVE